VRRGFTLMELMVALVLAGILVSVALGAYGNGARAYFHALSSYSRVFDEKFLELKKSIRDLRGCSNAKRL
jgi:prepilin-type N-terminal cleavage/methylation domain-containing protein